MLSMQFEDNRATIEVSEYVTISVLRGPRGMVNRAKPYETAVLFDGSLSHESVIGYQTIEDIQALVKALTVS